MGFEVIGDDEKIAPHNLRPPSVLREASYTEKKPPPIYGTCQGCKVSVNIPPVIKLPELRSYEGVCHRCRESWKDAMSIVTYGRFLKADEKREVEIFLREQDRK